MSDKTKTIIALGYFDSVHTGHRKIIKTAQDIAKEKGFSCAVFTFKGNLNEYIGKGDKKSIFTTEERKDIFDKIGVADVLFAPVTKDFLSLDKGEFLDYLNSIYDIDCYVCGSDYRFGKLGLGDVDFLREYAQSKCQNVVIEPLVFDQDKKISTSLIKELLKEGDIQKANQLLGDKYFVKGVVFKDRSVGKSIGFPTVNIKIDAKKSPLKQGVYAGEVELDKKYKAIINYGSRPTYNLDEKLVEAHIVDFDGLLYGKEITIKFSRFMREIIKFNSEKELTDRLKLDLEEIKGGKYD